MKPILISTFEAECKGIDLYVNNPGEFLRSPASGYPAYGLVAFGHKCC